MNKILVLWDEFGQNDGPMRAYLIHPSSAKSRKALLSMQGQFVNSTRTKEDNFVNEFSEFVYSEKKNPPLEKYRVKWPIKLSGEVTIVHTGFLP